MTQHLAIACPTCGSVRGAGITEMVAMLRAAGLLKAKSDSSPDVIRELFRASAAKLKCPGCGAIGLSTRGADEAMRAAMRDEDWGQDRACEACRAPIPPERLELLPDARLCAACQQEEDCGELADQREFCPRCGAVMRLVSRRGAGIARYTMRCPSCRR